MEQRDPSKAIFKAGNQSADDPLDFILSDETADSVGDIVRADGWDLSNFKNNPIALMGHDHRNIIGTWSNVRVQGKKLLGRLKLAAPGTSQLVDDVRKLVDQGILKAVSVGFSVKEYEPIDQKIPWGAWDITKAQLFEASLVAVGANPNALAIAKAYSPDTVDILFAQPSTTEDGPGDPRKRAEHKTLTPNLDAARETFAALGIE